MTLLQIVILAVIQGLAELLPVSSSAHVIAAAKLMRLDPTAPTFTLLLVMLHTGTMFAVIVYFWSAWRRAFFSSLADFVEFAKQVIVATFLTGIVALVLKKVIEHAILHSNPTLAKAEVEDLFSHLELLAAALAAVGVLILIAGLLPGRTAHRRINFGDSTVIGIIQGLCLPFRGFSRSGATISVGLLRGLERQRLEQYSFALAVVLTPAVVIWEGRRLIQHQAGSTPVTFHDFVPSLLGMLFSFIAGLGALKLLSRLLEKGQWWIFGVYCLIASAAMFGMYHAGY